MIRIGEYNNLKPARMTPQGLYLQDTNGEDVLLPRKYVPDQLDMEHLMRVFVYRDNENRPIATTLRPFITVGEFAGLHVRQVTQFGAFLDWGLEKDILAPHREQEGQMEEGKRYLVHLYLDDVSHRLVASNKLGRFLEAPNSILSTNKLEEGDEVDLLIWKETDLGVKVVVNQRYEGLIYRDSIFRRVTPGDKTKGYIKLVRDDGKLDVVLDKPGYERIEPAAQKVLDIIKLEGGYLPLHDKSDPEEIKRRLEMSKKTFKKAIGSLYREKRIVIEGNGIRLVKEEE